LKREVEVFHYLIKGVLKEETDHKHEGDISVYFVNPEVWGEGEL
jgi:hypothetical protein